MGCRGTIEVWENGGAPRSAEQPVVFYTHWGAREMLHDLKQVLKRKVRWGDPSYLCRMIFSEMIRDDVEGETGFGIQTRNVGDAEVEIVIDMSRKEVIYKSLYRDKNGLDDDTLPLIRERYTFEELINSEEI